MPIPASSDDRAVLHLGGGDVTHFLDRLVTTRVPDEDQPIRFSALLTPQGKILFDFFLMRAEDGFWLECPAESADDLIKRLTFYKLRADVTIADRRADLAAIRAIARPDNALAFADDPRHGDLPGRAIIPRDAAEPSAERPVALAVPEAGVDYAYGDAFPHDAGFDLMGGVDLDKGCFVGQEVVSRMAHRGTARRRPVLVTSQSGSLNAGDELLAGDRTLGTITSSDGKTGLSILRIDRAAKATATGEAITAGGQPVTLSRPAWAAYDWPAPDDTNDNGAAA